MHIIEVTETIAALAGDGSNGPNQEIENVGFGPFFIGATKSNEPSSVAALYYSETT
jgi:hypothetical protein